MSDNKDNTTHEGSMGTDRNPPSGTDLENRTDELSEEEQRLKKRIEELRKRDPFIYR